MHAVDLWSCELQAKNLMLAHRKRNSYPERLRSDV